VAHSDAINNLPKEALGGVLIAPRLDEDVQHDSVLIDRAPRPAASPRTPLATGNY